MGYYPIFVDVFSFFLGNRNHMNQTPFRKDGFFLFMEIGPCSTFFNSGIYHLSEFNLKRKTIILRYNRIMWCQITIINRWRRQNKWLYFCKTKQYNFKGKQVVFSITDCRKSFFFFLGNRIMIWTKVHLKRFIIFCYCYLVALIISVSFICTEH